MEYEIGKRPGATEFRLKGEMTFSDHHHFKSVLTAFEDTTSGQIIFNLDDLQGIDSTGLGMLILAQEEALKRGLTFTLERPQSDVKRLMDLAKFHRHFDIRN